MKTRTLKRLSLITGAVSTVLIMGGCSDYDKQDNIGSNNPQISYEEGVNSNDVDVSYEGDITSNNFNITYEADKEVDKIIFSIGDLKEEITPTNNDTKIKEGYKFNAALGEIEGDLSIQVIDNEKVIFEKSNEKIYLNEGKKVDIKIVVDKDGNLALSTKLGL